MARRGVILRALVAGGMLLLELPLLLPIIVGALLTGLIACVCRGPSQSPD